MPSALEPGSGAAVTGLFLGSLALAGAVALVTAPITPRMAVAQTVADPNDPSTAVVLPAPTAVAFSGNGRSVRRVDPRDYLVLKGR